MVQPNDNEEELNLEPEDDFYGKSSTEEAPRVDIDLPKGAGGIPQSLSDAENAPNQTDLQTTLARLFPKFKDKYIDEIADAIMIGRISPDVFLDLIYLTVTDIVEDMDADNKGDTLYTNISVQAVINKIYAVFSIGLEGKGRLDAINVCGASRDAQELDAVAKGLGLG
jgi:hypothetical protein